MHQSNQVNHSNGSEIAIIGMACRVPGARRLAQFWQNLRDGVESLVPLSDEELLAAGISQEMLNNPNYVKAVMILDDVEMFDAPFFGYNPREAEVMDPQQRLFLECAWEALEDGGYNGEKYKGAIGVYAGVGANTYLFNLSSDSDLARTVGSYQTMISNDKDFISTRVSYKLNLKGPSLTVQTACSTSLVAAHLACQSLLNGECDMALAGGVSIRLPQRAGYLFEPEMIHSPDGHCRAFDARAQGPSGGNGVGVVLLKRLSDALSDGDNIYAVVKGSAINNDGALKVGYTAPSVEGQARVIAEALAIAGVNPETVSFVEAHGTGTALGDPIEIAALTKAYRAYTQEKNFCAVGSVKTNIGHLDTAAGVAGLIKAALSLKYKQIPPSLHFEKPNPKIDFENSPFYVNTELIDWKNGTTPRRAGVSSFGMGGTNAHLILEEPPLRTESSEASRPWQLLTLSARSASALERVTENLAEHFEHHPELKLADAAYTLQLGRKTFNHRRMLVCRDLEDAAKALKSRDPQRVFSSKQEASARPLVFMFPGGGAQYVQMGQELYHTEKVFRENVDRCMEFLKSCMGFDLRALLYPDEERAEEASRRMERTSVALPALFTIEYAMAQLLMSWGVRPQAMIGHSLGEYAAACLAGVISLEDALSLVALRGKLFEQLPEGSMLSVPLSEEELKPFLGRKLSMAAVNGPSLCVVSGPTEAIEELEKTLADNSIEVGRLHIAVAAHSEMVTPILDEFRAFVETIELRAPEIPYISTLTGTWAKAEDVTTPEYWAQHLRQTVRFGEGLRVLWGDEDRILLEVGPGQTLSTLARQHANKPSGQIILSSLRHPHEQQPDVAFLLSTIGRLWIAGGRVDWQGLYAREKRRRLPLPTYPFESQRYWIDSDPANSSLKPAQASPGRRREPADWFYLPSWKRSVHRAATSKSVDDGRNWLLLGDRCGIGAQLAQRLREMGERVAIVETGERFASLGNGLYTSNLARAEDFRELLRELKSQDHLPQKIVHLSSLGPITQPVSETGLLADELERGFYSLVGLAQMLEKENVNSRLEITVISNGLHDITGDEPLCPQKNTLLGPCIVIPQEYPNITCRSIDVLLPSPESEQGEKLVGRLLTELLADPAEQTLAFRSNHRWVQSFEPARLEETDSTRRLRENGVYLIIGGLGDVGHILATHLAKVKGVRLVLTGRSTLPPRSEWQEWLDSNQTADDPLTVETGRKIRRAMALEEAGAEVVVASADVADLEQMKRVVDETFERFGALHGVIQAAGVSKERAFCTIQETTRDGGEWFRSKAEGLLVLDEVLGDHELDFCLLTSSLSSILGGLGHISYTASNLFMDAFAQKQNRVGRVNWTSINWEGWQPDEQLPAEFNLASAQLQLTLTPSEGMGALGRILASTSGAAQLAVSTSDLQSRIDEWVKREWLTEAEGSGQKGVGALHRRPDLPNVYVAPATEMQQEIVAIWQGLIGIEDIGIHDNFFELGGSSLLATQLISRLRDKFQVELTLRSFFESPTIAGLAEAVEQAREQGIQAPPPTIQKIPRRGQAALLSADGVLTIPELLKPEISAEVAPTENP